MRKIKTYIRQFTSTYKPALQYVLRLDVVNDALVARYFQVRSSHELGDLTPQDSMSSFDPTSTTLLRQAVTQTNFVRSTAVTNDDAFAGKVLSEVGRHIFRPTIGDNGICGFGERQDFAMFSLPFGHNAKVGEPYNHFTESTSVKGPVGRDSRLRDGQPIILMYSDTAGAPLEQWTLIYVDSPPFLLADNTVGEFEIADDDFFAESLLPSVSLNSAAQVAPDGVITVNVSLSRDGSLINYTGKLTVEAVSGYVPNTRVAITGGSGAFKVMALGLTAGETLRVKVGSKNITGMAEISVPVA
jgi:hypothetical protein